MNRSQDGQVFLGYPAGSPAAAQLHAGAEISPDFPREWVEFPCPDDPQRVFRVDLTWLESRWHCVFGTSACRGISAARPDAGCCSHGAFLADDEDRDRLYNAALQLPARYWQHHPGHTEATVEADLEAGHIEPWLEWDELDNEDGEAEPALRTAMVDGACIFANRAGWPTGAGCSLHQWAVATGQDLTEIKPEVCWQVPIFREDTWVERPDGVEILRTTIGEYDRRAWGEGGLDFPWWCTSDPACHTAPRPVWESMSEELTNLMGQAGYQQLADILRARASAPSPLPHPATRLADGLADPLDPKAPTVGSPAVPPVSPPPA